MPRDTNSGTKLPSCADVALRNYSTQSHTPRTDSYLGVKFCVMVELCPGLEFLPFWWQYL